MPAYNDTNFEFRCSCPRTIVGAKAFLYHMKVVSHPYPVLCGRCQLPYEHLTSLLRHTREEHYPYDDDDQEEVAEEVVPNVGGAEGNEGAVGGVIVPHDLEVADVGVGVQRINLSRSAAVMILNLRQTGAVTSSSIERVQTECLTLLDDVTSVLRDKVHKFFEEEGILNQPRCQEFLNEFHIEDPFQEIKTLKQQLKYFATNMGLVLPQEKFLDFRIDYYLNPVTCQYEPVQVPMTFQYIPIILTLKLVLSDPKTRELINSERPSTDGVLRSYLDGRRAKNHPLICRYPNIIRIQLYWDDLEVTNPLGSKTTIHKLAAFYFSIQNLPIVECSQLSSIYLLMLAYSEDLKIKNGIEKILAPFLADMKKLESETGVQIEVNEERICLRATVACACGDGLAAHLLLGFLGPGARHFCRKCDISRRQLHEDCTQVGRRRTKEEFIAQAQQVEQNPRLATEFGVKKNCPLHVFTNFSATDDGIFDIFHEMLEGVCHWVIILTLKAFVAKGYITLETFNSRLVSFNYGVTDIKNKPSANISSLTGKKLKQTGSQTHCLLRIFGFLVPEGPENDVNLKLFNILQELMLIEFAEEIRPQDVNRFKDLVAQHHRLFKQLYVDGQPQDQEDSDDSELEDDPEAAPAGEAAPQAEPVIRINPRNKLHDMLHEGDEMEEVGPPIRMWCARYEARHHLFVKFGAVCGNFINLPKTMAQMYQISTLSGLLKRSLRSEDIVPQSLTDGTVETNQYSRLLIEFGLEPAAVISETQSVIIAGEVYRPGLFVLTDAKRPIFSLIREVFIFGDEVLFVLTDWETIAFVRRYCAYKIISFVRALPKVISHKHLARHGAFSAWNPFGERTTFISPRTIIF